MTVSTATYNIVASTQIRENYGAHDWNGKGQCPQYWKCKGGNEHVIASFRRRYCDASIENLVKVWAYKNLSSDQYYDEYLIDWKVVKITDDDIQEGIDAIKAEYAERYEGGKFSLKEMLEHDFWWMELSCDVQCSNNPKSECLLDKCRGVLLDQLSKEAA